MKRHLLNKAFLFGIILILLGSGLVVGYTEGFLTVKNNLKNCKLVKSDFSSNIEYPIMAPMPIYAPDREPNFFNISIIDTPNQFNWKNKDGKDWTSPVKNQGNCGSCWLFASMGALESVINIKEDCAELDPDLSEQYVLSCMPEAGSCSGGNVENCVYYFINSTGPEGNFHNGVIFESCLDYYADDDIPCSEKCENWEDYLVPISGYEESWEYYNIPELRDTIKSLVYQKGPIMVYFWASQRFMNWGLLHKFPSQYYPDYNENCPYFVNHGITVVGWKDDPSVGNGGYWICKNTWGTNWGYNGFFNIEYDILNLGGFIAWVDYDPESFDWGPIAPDINGPKTGEPGEEYGFIFTSMDPDGDDDVFYYIDWGDGFSEEWIGPYGSGESVEIKHIWENTENYNIRVKAKDDLGRESNWAEQNLRLSRDRKPIYGNLIYFLQRFFNHFCFKDLLNINH